MEDMLIVIVLVGAVGVMFGSFVGAFVWRWRQTHDDDGNKRKLSKRKAAELSIATGRSMCPHCKHQLRSYDLVPIGSWLSLKGRCRYCSKKIGWQYPLVELLTGSLYVLSYVTWPYGWSALGWLQFGLWLLIVTGLIILSVYDLRWLLLPFKLIYPLLILAALLVVARAVDTSDWSVIFGAVAAAVVLGGLFYGLHTVSRGKWIGGGDVVAAPMLGLLAGGLGEVFILVFVASIVGILVGVPVLLRTRNRKAQIPFGPMLFVSAFVVFLCGSRIIDWYLDKIVL